MKESEASYHLQLALFLLVVVLCFLFVQPLLTVFFTSVLLSYVFYPLYLIFKKRIKFRMPAILLTLVVMLLLFLLPFAILIAQIPMQAGDIISFVKQNLLENNTLSSLCSPENPVACLTQKLFTGSDEAYNSFIREPVLHFASQIAAKIVWTIPSLIANITLIIFVSYYMIRDGPLLVSGFMRLIPLEEKKRSLMLSHFKKTARLVVFSNLVVAFAQGVLGAIGFWAVGMPYPMFWGLLMGIFSMLPIVGAGLVWMPVAIFMLLSGIVSGDSFGIYRGAGLLLYGIFVISTVDNIIRGKMASDSGTVHPLTLLVGIIGGVEIFGIIGLFIGPVILSLAIIFMKDFSTLYSK